MSRSIVSVVAALLISAPGVGSATAMVFDFNTFTYVDADQVTLFGGGDGVVSLDGSTVDLFEDSDIPIVTAASYDPQLSDFTVSPTFEVMAGDSLSFDWALSLPTDGQDVNVDGLSVALFDAADVTVANTFPVLYEVFFVDTEGSGSASIALDPFLLTGLTVGFDISLISDPLFTGGDDLFSSAASVANLTLTRQMTGGGGGTTVPEPGVLVLFALGLALLAVRGQALVRIAPLR